MAKRSNARRRPRDSFRGFISWEGILSRYSFSDFVSGGGDFRSSTTEAFVGHDHNKRCILPDVLLQPDVVAMSPEHLSSSVLGH